MSAASWSGVRVSFSDASAYVARLVAILFLFIQAKGFVSPTALDNDYCGVPAIVNERTIALIAVSQRSDCFGMLGTA